MIDRETSGVEYPAIDRAFSKQSVHFDRDDEENRVLQDMRRQVYRHVDRFIRPKSKILELNAGTGIDALHFHSLGHTVLATDLAAGMVEQINLKKDAYHLDRLTAKQLSYESLHELRGVKFDYVFSNFGGLNCIPDLSVVTSGLRNLLNDGAFVTWVIMPRVALWEMASILKGNSNAFRRFSRGGVMAHLEAEYFRTWYHSVSAIRKAFGDDFRLIASEGLGVISPPPHRGDFPRRFPQLYRSLRRADRMLRGVYPFNRWGDHVVVTFRHVR